MVNNKLDRLNVFFPLKSKSSIHQITYNELTGIVKCSIILLLEQFNQ